MSDLFAMRGVIEGFYGRPWTHAQRLRAIDLLGARGMNTYFVSTKDEPWQRADWRSPLPAPVVDRLADLADAAARAGMDLGVSTSPGLTVEYSDPATVDDIVARFVQLADRGIHLFGLFLDDIPGELQHESDRAQFADLTAAHERLLADVAARMPAGTRLVVCLTTYHGFGDESELARIAAALPADVPVLWTGRQICSAYLHSDDARRLAATIGRPPLFWDNYPVNDVAMTHELHIGPLRGRDHDLAESSLGLLANPMSLFEASLLPLCTVADYLDDPRGYDAEASWDRALVDLFPDADDRAAYRAVARCHLDSCLSEQAAPDLEEQLSRAMFEWRTGDAQQASHRLADEANRLRAAVTRVDSDEFGNQGLRHEVAPWLGKLRLACAALDALAAYVSGDTGIAPVRDAATALAADRTRSAGDGVQMTLDEIVALAESGAVT